MPPWIQDQPSCFFPLSEIICGDHGGSHTSFTSTGDPERPTTESRDYYAYELNLVIDGPAGGRRLLFASADWAWLRSLGTRLGEFLGVPVIDRLHHG